MKSHGDTSRQRNVTFNTKHPPNRYNSRTLDHLREKLLNSRRNKKSQTIMPLQHFPFSSYRTFLNLLSPITLGSKVDTAVLVNAPDEQNAPAIFLFLPSHSPNPYYVTLESRDTRALSYSPNLGGPQRRPPR